MSGINKGDLLISEDRRDDLPPLKVAARNARSLPEGYRLFLEAGRSARFRQSSGADYLDRYCLRYVAEALDRFHSPGEFARRLEIPDLAGCTKIARDAQQMEALLGDVLALMTKHLGSNSSCKFLELAIHQWCHWHEKKYIDPNSFFSELDKSLVSLRRMRDVCVELGLLSFLDDRMVAEARAYCRRLPLVLACRTQSGRIDQARIRALIDESATEPVDSLTDKAQRRGLRERDFSGTWAKYTRSDPPGYLPKTSTLITAAMIDSTGLWRKPLNEEGIRYFAEIAEAYKRQIKDARPSR